MPRYTVHLAKGQQTTRVCCCMQRLFVGNEQLSYQRSDRYCTGGLSNFRYGLRHTEPITSCQELCSSRPDSEFRYLGRGHENTREIVSPDLIIRTEDTCIVLRDTKQQTKNREQQSMSRRINSSEVGGGSGGSGAPVRGASEQPASAAAGNLLYGAGGPPQPLAHLPAVALTS